MNHEPRELRLPAEGLGWTLTALAERIDITLANLSILKTGKARAIRFSTLEAICHVLGCQPGDILEFHPDSGTAEHPRPNRRMEN